MQRHQCRLTQAEWVTHNPEFLFHKQQWPLTVRVTCFHVRAPCLVILETDLGTNSVTHTNIYTTNIYLESSHKTGSYNLFCKVSEGQLSVLSGAWTPCMKGTLRKIQHSRQDSARLMVTSGNQNTSDMGPLKESARCIIHP